MFLLQKRKKNQRSRNKLGGNGYVHYLDCGVGFTNVWKLIKLHTLNMSSFCVSFTKKYCLVKTQWKQCPILIHGKLNKVSYLVSKMKHKISRRQTYNVKKKAAHLWSHSTVFVEVLPLTQKESKKESSNMQIFKYLCNRWLRTHILITYQITVNSQALKNSAQ